MTNEIQELLNKILDLNIQERCNISYATYHVFFDTHVGLCHGPTGTIFECLMWLIESFPDPKHMEAFLEEVLEYLECWGIPKDNDNYVACITDDDEPGEEFRVYIWDVNGEP